MSTTKLQVLASALLKAAQPDLLAQILNSGLNGNKVLRAQACGDTVQIGRRRTPQDVFTYDVSIAADGTLPNHDTGSKLAKTLDKAISINAIADVEMLTIPAVPAMMWAIQTAEFVLQDEETKSRIGKLGLGNDLNTTVYGLGKMSEVVDPQLIVTRMSRFSNDGLKFSLEGTDIVMRDDERNDLASVNLAKPHDAASSNSIVALHAMNTVLRAAVAGLDATLDLVARMEQHREAQRRAAEQHQRDYEAERHAETVRRAQSVLGEFSVSAGSVFVMRTGSKASYWEEEEIVNTILMAERDLDARDYLELLDNNLEGRARIIHAAVLDADPDVKDRIQRALDLTSVSEDEDMRPA